MAIDEGKSRPSSFVPFGRTQAGHLKTADTRHAWKQQSFPSPLQAHQVEVDGKGKGKERRKRKIDERELQVSQLWRDWPLEARMSKTTSVEVPDLRCSRTPKGQG